MRYIHLAWLSMAVSIFVAEANAQSGWYRQHVPANGSLLDVHFIDANYGTVVGAESDSFGIVHPLILQTTNGGASWSRQLLPIEGGLSAVSLTDSANGTAVGWLGYLLWYGIAAGPLILHTTDRGLTWNSQLSDSVYTLNSVCFTDVNTGTAVGWDGSHGGGKILRTTDGGKSWIHQLSGTTFGLRSVCFSDGKTGTVVGDRGTILRTTDGGSTWIDQSVMLSFGGFERVFFTDAETGTAVGNARGKALFPPYPVVRHTTDGGATWTDVTSGITALPYGICFVDSMTGTLVGSNELRGGAVIFRTTDGGATWAPQSIGVDEFLAVALNSVSLSDAKNGCAVGAERDSTGNWRPLILRTNTGGVASTKGDPGGDMPRTFLLSQNYPNPLNPSTVIEYAVGGIRSQGSNVKLAIYDLLGREVAVLVNEKKAPGSYEVRFDATGLASGVYLYRVTAGDFAQTKKMIIVK